MPRFTPIAVHPTLAKATDVNGYSDAGATLKNAFHSHGRKLLSALAAALGDTLGEFTIRSNRAGIAVSGEVTLHSDHLYVQMSESCMQRGLSLLYRSCSSQKDCCGNQNHFVSLAAFGDDDRQQQILNDMAELIDTEISRKKNAALARAAAKTA